MVLLTVELLPLCFVAGAGPHVVSGVRAGDTITLVLEDAPPGLTGFTVGIRATPTRTAVVAASTAGVAEHTAGDGSTYYTAARTIPLGTTPTNMGAGTGYEAYWQHSSLAEPVVEEIVVS
jgi:hypothetical protein